jgi:hypothetical protein
MSVVQVPLLKRDGTQVAAATIDATDAVLVTGWVWRLHPTGYAVRYERDNLGLAAHFLHRFLLGLEPRDPLQGDHMNRDRLDCRRENLRVVTKAQNMQNRPSVRGATSKYRGVWWSTDRGLWVAEVAVDGKRHYVGAFEQEDVAGVAASAFRAEHLPYSVEAA